QSVLDGREEHGDAADGGGRLRAARAPRRAAPGHVGVARGAAVDRRPRGGEAGAAGRPPRPPPRQPRLRAPLPRRRQPPQHHPPPRRRPGTPGCIYLVMELCEGGDLATYIERSGGRVEESVARNFMRQIEYPTLLSWQRCDTQDIRFWSVQGSSSWGVCGDSLWHPLVHGP
uniref:Protein kinase domain-containing protein n=1 Tax=Aegilops tauschii subsp. strangulata TaxID=200361 RepID=A0A453DJ54_AEGTS